MNWLDSAAQYWIAAVLAMVVGAILAIRWIRKVRRILSVRAGGCGSGCGGGCGDSNEKTRAARRAEFVRFSRRDVASPRDGAG